MKQIIQHLRTDWYKYLLEILVIILGVWLAFALNSWNEERKILQAEQAYLRGLQKDFQDALEESQYQEELLSKILSKVKQLAQYTGPEPVNIDEDLFNQLVLSGFKENPTFLAQSGVLLALISSGDLKIISNSALKYKLASWNSTKQLVLDQESRTAELRQEIFGLIHRKMILRTIPSDQDLERIGLSTSRFSSNNRKMLNDPEFENIIVNYALSANRLQREYRSLQETIQQILMEIDKSLQE